LGSISFAGGGRKTTPRTIGGMVEPPKKVIYIALGKRAILEKKEGP